MSFCRFSEGDVYMYPTEKGIVCQCDKHLVMTTIDAAVEHLLEHRVAGDNAPYERAIDMLRHTTLEMVDGKAVYGTV